MPLLLVPLLLLPLGTKRGKCVSMHEKSMHWAKMATDQDKATQPQKGQERMGVGVGVCVVVGVGVWVWVWV